MNEKLRELQLVQLEILKDVVQVCKEKNLKYYLIGGTLLGAVRHNGFIPWDDDVDIGMYREDYNKLQDIISSYYPNKYFVQNFTTDKRYTRYICKIRLNNTVQIEKSSAGVKTHKGIFIDVFPLDFVKKPDGYGVRIRGLILRLLFAYKTIKHGINYDSGKIKKSMKKVLKIFFYLVPQSLINYLFDYICTFDNDKECQYTTSFASGYGWKKQLVKNEVYSNGTELIFEGNKFKAPLDYDYILKRLFNNYMELPPLEKRYIGHKIIDIDLGPYKNLFEE